ncbi:MAG: hypothetical protein J5641_02005 [Bacteroidales bacterium]|nr:hypothetical protein [Bacteroidales bacterium]
MYKILTTGTMLLTIMTMTACKSGTENHLTPDLHDSTALSWETIDEKLATPLSEDECLFILSDTTLDEGQSEGIGLRLFRLLKGNQQANELFLNARKRLSTDEGDNNLLRLMDLMSIDIAFAGYRQYDYFLQDFPMFRDCAGAEEQFDQIMANGL